MAADRRQWDVFLSFRGEDTRHGFTKTLYKALTDLGIRAFLDDDGLRRGDEIAPSLLEAIEDSAAAVVILSARYADSRWCLEELARICQLSAARLVLPVFYFVDPSHVRRQSGPFEMDFRAHEARFEKVMVERWRKALETVGNFAGFPVFDHSQEKHIIKSLVKTVTDKMAKTPENLDYTVGLESSIEKLTRLFELKANGVKVLGLYGMGGVGKTTLAKALFNHLVGRAGFESRSFVSNVREIVSRENSLESLRKKLAQDLSVDKKSLVVLDDVDHADQVKALVNGEGLFFEGSRIIVTTRDREALPEKIVSVMYEVKELDSEEALKLFSYHSQRREKPTENLRSISREIVSLTGGLPLALEVFGSTLLDKRRIEEWRDSLQKLREIRPANLQDVLKISYNGLDEQEKRVLLDIACFFAGTRTKRDYLVDVFGGCGFNGEIAISDLTSKSLIKIKDAKIVEMHDQIRDMGRQIVKEESVADPRSQSRLWNRDDIMAVLLDNQNRPCVQGITLDVPREKMVKDVDGGRIAWDRLHRSPNLRNALSFLKERYKQYKEDEAERKKKIKILGKNVERIPNLRLLRVNNVSLEGDFEFPHHLKWLQWNGCPLKDLRSDIYAQGLVVADLSGSKIERFWSRHDNKVMAENLKVLNLSDCCHLLALPKLSENHKLEKLILVNCVNLTQIEDSIGNSNTLIHLDLQNCQNLSKLPSDVSGWKSLHTLILSGCFKLKQLPENIGDARSLKQLFVNETAIETLPESIFRLTSLETLDLRRCSLVKRLPICIGKLCSLKELTLNSSGLVELPDSIGGLENLETLGIMWCSSLNVVPDSIGDLKQLKELFCLSSPIGEIPDGVGSLPNLKSLSIGRGNFIGALPRSIDRLYSLVDLQIHETSITNLPDEIGGLKSMKKLELWKCKSLVSLPDSIGNALSLTTLIIFEGIIKELPESIGKLENIVTLSLNFCRELRKLPDSIGGLKSLHRLLLKETAVTELPESFGKLLSLVELQVSKNPHAYGYTESEHEGVFFPMSFSNLSLLSVLNVCARKISGEIPDDFEELVSLERLNMGYNCFTRLSSSLRSLSVLKKLELPNCTKLKALPPLPSSLVEINLANCFSLEIISDLSNLVSLEELDLTNCERVEDIPGLECLESMKRLYLSCCNKCSLITKKRLAKASLRKIRNLSMPGSKIPSWFTRDVVTFTKHRNRPIKGVAICTVVSLDHGIQDENIDKFPAVVDIQAQVLKQDLAVFTTVFNMRGVPRRSEDQIHLCRFPATNPLVSQLKDGFKIAVTRRNPPFMKGIELKKWGVHLIYEGDDDYEGDEESLKESQQSISEKLAKFFSTYEEEEKEEEEAPEISGRADEFSLPFHIVALSLLLLLCSWFYYTSYGYSLAGILA